MNNNHLYNFNGLNVSRLTFSSDGASDDVSDGDLLRALNISQFTSGSHDEDKHLLNVSHLSQFTNATGPKDDQDGLNASYLSQFSAHHHYDDQDVVHESIRNNTSSDLDSCCSNSSSLAAIISNMDIDLKDDLLTYVFKELKKKSSSSERRPMMSIVASIMPKPVLSTCMGFQISSREFRDARLHAKMYGAGSSLPEKIRFKRNRLDEAVVTHFIEWCNKADIFQNMAFGQKMVHYSNGVHIAIESIKTRLCKAKIQEAYAKEWEEEEYENLWIEENVNIDAEEGNSGSRWNIGDRCCACCSKSKVQCFKQSNHDGRHLFTPKTRLSPSKVSDIISQLTSGDIESLRGVDIVDTECGYENFSKMREIVQSLIEIGRFGRAGSPEGKALIDDIDKVETFHKVGYPQHLGIEGSLHVCTCFECGFQEPCEKKHIGACDECVFSFCVFDRMFKFWEQIDSILRDHKDYEACAFLQDDMEFWHDRIEDCLRNFLDYRRHIAQTEDEAIYDARFYAELPDDESVLIIDYKMKILASLFRESTRAWYGKKGFSCFGSLIILPSAEKEFRQVVYHLFFSDDTTQDTPSVNTIKL